MGKLLLRFFGWSAIALWIAPLAASVLDVFCWLFGAEYRLVAWDFDRGFFAVLWVLLSGFVLVPLGLTLVESADQ